ncbi:protein mono-ADP-ribosyltransferase PARP14-like [Protopterus annectens]|uniref:protein mono-ADP-ribosyltransferase PARP14-like n=1 Tax=Protopterus annectens TaxID=7888 RepID=UPI001CFC0DF1|nr:protein mono-ADP-ribosyltransferase PARP14-like [Protopterus annectens]
MMAANYPYPLIVEGRWNEDIAKTIKTKLHLHFQSQKKSNGGECIVEYDGSPRNQAIVWYSSEEIRNRVLEKEKHVLDLREKGNVILHVRLKEDLHNRSESLQPTESEQVSESKSLEKGSLHIGERLGSNKRVAAADHQGPARKHRLYSIAAHAMNRKEYCSNEDAKEVLQEKTHCISDVEQLVTASEKGNGNKIIEEQPQTRSVILKNLKDSMTKEMLSMLVENISELTEDIDFCMEMLPELNAAVITFNNSGDASEFAFRCPRNVRICQQKVETALLEPTKSIIVEDVNPLNGDQYLALYFENPKNGGAVVTDVRSAPEMNGFIVTFAEYRDVTKAMSKRHVIGGKNLTAYPYYASLGTALYGKERPALKMPDPFTLSLDSYLLQYLHSEKKHITLINSSLSKVFCELEWPNLYSENPMVKMLPSGLLLKQRSAKLIETWKQDVSAAFSSAISGYTVAEYTVTSQVWDIAKHKVDSFTRDGIYIIPNVTKGKVVLVGRQNEMKLMQENFKEVIDAATKQVERQTKSIREAVELPPAMYSILLNEGLQNDVAEQFPLLKYEYDASTKSVTLFGLQVEVYSVKSDILTKIMHMKQKRININKNIFNFLEQVDSKDFACHLFIQHHINAVYEISDMSLLLIGSSEKSLSEAEKHLKKMLIFKCIDLEDEKVVRKREWREIISNLDKSYNSSVKTFTVDVTYEETNGQVVIAGISDTVIEIHETLFDFVDKNTHVQKTIPVKYKAVAQFVNQKKKDILLKIMNKGVDVQLNIQTLNVSVLLSGSRAEMSYAVPVVEKLLSSLHCEVLTINKPGAVKFFKDKEAMLVAEADRVHGCLLRLQEDGEVTDVDSNAEVGGRSTCEVRLPGGILIAVYKDNLCHHKVDVVVNASNEDLKHIGGLAGALLDAAGPSLQTECNKLVKEKGSLKPGDVVITESGRLPCKHVIHAVGPRWNSSDPEKCKYLLKKVIKNTLNLATEYFHKSIAIPAISSGIFSFPLELCAKLIVSSIRDYCEDNYSKTTLRHIHLVNIDDKTVAAINDAVKNAFLGQVVQLSPIQPRSDLSSQERRAVHSAAEIQKLQTKENLRISLKKGNIQDATTDVVVNTVSKNLDLASGAVSNALLQKAGPRLQSFIREEAKSKVVEEGSVLVTDGANLDCSKVFHVIAPYWDHGSGRADKILNGIVEKCLIHAETNGMHSITFPAFGAGNLGFPKPLVASLMLQRVMEFSNKMEPKHLKQIDFCLHPSDNECLQAFSTEFGKHSKGKVLKEKQHAQASSGAQSGQAFFGKISSPTLGVNEMQVGSLKLEVLTGDITKEKTDAIVNSSNDRFTLKQGVSKAVLDAAGQAVEVECAQKGAQPHQGLIITQPGNLACQHIIHVVGRTDPNDIKTVITQALQECEKMQLSSVAFPAIGTGQGHVNPAMAADAMIDAISDFSSQRSPQCLKIVRIVIFQAHMSAEFYKSMQKREKTSLPEPESWWGKFTSLFTKPNRDNEGSTTEKDIIMESAVPPAIFQICGECRNNVDDTVSWLSTMIVKEHTEQSINDDSISCFGEREYQQLKELQKQMQIIITFQNKENYSAIQVCGLTRDVLTACTSIQKMIKEVRDEQTKKRDAELLSSIVEWQYKEKDTFVSFDNLANFALEQGYNEKKKNIVVKIRKTPFTVDIQNMKAISFRGTEVIIKRVDKRGGKLTALWG